MATYRDYLEIVLLGELAVGKSCFTASFAQNDFLDGFSPTIEESCQKVIIVDDKQYALGIVDIASGFEEFEYFMDNYHRSGDGFLLLFSVTDRRSFERVPAILKRLTTVRDEKEVNSKILLVGTKSDLNDEREVTKEEAKNLANDLQLPYIETSAKHGTNVEEAFQQIVRLISSSPYLKPRNKEREKEAGKCQIC